MWQKVKLKRIVQDYTCVENTTKSTVVGILKVRVVDEILIDHVPDVARKMALHLACKFNVPSFAMWKHRTLVRAIRMSSGATKLGYLRTSVATCHAAHHASIYASLVRAAAARYALNLSKD